MTLTRSQRSNLRKLADYLEALPSRYWHFDMGDFMGLDNSDQRVINYARKNGGVSKCGTVACAVGHGPAAGILFRPCDFETNWLGERVPDWQAYSARFTPRDSWDEIEFDWAFGSLWGKVDNHHYGAAARIRYLLELGVPSGYELLQESKYKDAYRSFDKRYAAVTA